MKRFLVGLTVLSLVVLLGGGLVLAQDKYTVVSDIPWPPFEMELEGVVIRKDSGLNLVSALTGKGPTGAIGAQRATTGGWWVEDNLQAADFDVELKQYATYPLAILDLVAKRIDAVIQDEPASISSLTAFPDDLTVAGIINTHEYFGFIVPKGDPNGLLPRMNDAMVVLGAKTAIAPTGIEEFVITEGSFWDNLVAAYFGPSTEKIEAAWSKCKDLLSSATCLEDLENYARCMADAVK